MNTPLAFKALNLRIPITIAVKGREFMNHGSELVVLGLYGLYGVRFWGFRDSGVEVLDDVSAQGFGALGFRVFGLRGLREEGLLLRWLGARDFIPIADNRSC